MLKQILAAALSFALIHASAASGWSQVRTFAEAGSPSPAAQAVPASLIQLPALQGLASPASLSAPALSSIELAPLGSAPAAAIGRVVRLQASRTGAAAAGTSSRTSSARSAAPLAGPRAALAALSRRLASAQPGPSAAFLERFFSMTDEDARGLNALPSPVAARRPSNLPEPSHRLIARLDLLARTDKPAALRESLAVLRDSRDQAWEVKIAALRALDACGDEAVVPLLEILNSHPSYYLRREAAGMLALRGERLGERKQAVIDALQKARRHEVPAVRIMAGEALRLLGATPVPEPEVKVPVPAPSAPSASPQAAPKLPGGMKAAMAMLVALLGILFITSMTQPAAHPPAEPAPVVQVDKPGVPAGPAVQAPAPQDPNAKALAQIEENTRRIAAAQEKLAKQAEDAQKSQSDPTSKLLGLLFAFGPLIFIGWLVLRAFRGGIGGANNPMKAVQLKRLKMVEERPDVKFSDVAGIDDAMGDIMEIKRFLEDPAKYKRLGAEIPKGVLLKGPPGTGKTLLAKALAGETNVPFLSISGSDFIEMFVGVGAARMNDLFDRARALGRCIIFLDEADAVLKSRDAEGSGLGSNSEREQTVGAFLTNMDGFDNSSGIIVIAATNRPEVIDPAAKRPGRFDKTITVGTPDRRGREAILQVHAKKVRLGADADLDYIAKRTPGLTGAFLRGVVNEGALQASREDADVVSNLHLSDAVDRLMIGGKRHMFLTDEVRLRLARHEAGHTLGNLLTQKGSLPTKVTIIPTDSGALGWADSMGEEDKLLMTRGELIDRLVGILGGYVAEELYYDGDVSTGPSNDLEKATELTRKMVKKWGMGKSIMVIGADEQRPFAPPEHSQATAYAADQEVKRILDEAKARTRKLLEANRPAHDAMAKALLERETLSKDEIEELVPAELHHKF